MFYIELDGVVTDPKLFNIIECLQFLKSKTNPSRGKKDKEENLIKENLELQSNYYKDCMKYLFGNFDKHEIQMKLATYF